MTIWRFIRIKYKEWCKVKESAPTKIVKEIEPIFIPKQKKRGLEDLQAGEFITAYWDRQITNNGIGKFEVLSNDPNTRKILLQKRWSNFAEVGIPEYEKVIFSYDSIHFKDFNLLNPKINEVKKELPKVDINKLQKQVKEAIQKEDWQRVDELNEEIKKTGNRAPEL